MTDPLYVPRINNNDDEVLLVSLQVANGDAVQAGQAVAEIESEKATVVVEAETDGYVVGISGIEGEMVTVGAVLIWIGETPQSQVPDDAGEGDTGPSTRTRPTAGAMALLRKHGLSESAVPVSGSRMQVGDVEAYLSQNPPAGAVPAAAAGLSDPPAAAGRAAPLSAYEAAMMQSVLWHGREAVPTYLEAAYDETPWQEFAQSFRDEEGLLSSPLVPLIAYQLVRYVLAKPGLNSTISDGQRFLYDAVNLGFTVDVGDKLFLPVIHDAQNMTAREFVDAFGRLHRAAMRGRLQPEEMRGATVAVSSMARWPVLRHMPILPAHVSLMVAHSAPNDGRCVLGATYDHRVLDGAAAFQAVHSLTKPDGEAIRKTNQT